jgi:hypothetical protein
MQATLKVRSRSRETYSRKDCMVRISFHPYVGHPTTNMSTPLTSTGCPGSNLIARTSPDARKRIADGLDDAFCVSVL